MDSRFPDFVGERRLVSSDGGSCRPIHILSVAAIPGSAPDEV
jgi:hypothetical protein